MREMPYSLREWLRHSGRAPRTAGTGAHYLRSLAIGLAAAVFLTLSGVFGTDGEPFALRLVYWIVLMAVGNLASITALRVVRRYRPFARRPVAQWAVATLSLMPLSLLVWGLNGLMFGYWFELGGLLILMPNILLVAAAITAINALGDRQPAKVFVPAEASASPSFTQRLPFRLRSAKIRAVQAEDHYLRVHTDAGEALILMRLTDAVAELAGIEGARTHRSWWVARAAVTGARRSEGRVVLELACGLEVPVSRRLARSLREDGWF